MRKAAKSCPLTTSARRLGFAVTLFGLLSLPAAAAEGGHGLDGATLGVAWALPFVGILLSIALGPLLMPHFWHRHFGKVAAAWALAFLVPFAIVEGLPAVITPLAEALLHDYIPFVVLLGALFTIAGGVLVTGNLHGSPRTNLALLGIGTLLASVIGTTGASMVLIRPLIRANDGRHHNVHVIVFFIFLVSNIGGSLTPVGDPPLFLGYLRGIDFFWTTTHMLKEAVLAAFVLLALFYVIDHRLYHRDDDFKGRLDPTPDTDRLGLEGTVNLILLLVVVGAVLMSGAWKPGIGFHVAGAEVELQNLVRDALLVVAALASLWLTPGGLRARNGFEWEPILEVTKLFAGIFVTIIPVLAMLKAAHDGAFAPLIGLVTAADGKPIDAMYFWATGLLSSFLDNAPTYLVFFNLAGGDPTQLMTEMAGTLAAISAGAVFMGAITYIGNAPNFMVKSIAEASGIRMPSFFGYMAWSAGILLPLFLIMTVIFFV